MSVLVDKKTRVVVQGITGRDGSFHTKGMLDYGTRVVAGVTPGKAGTEVHGVPVFGSVQDAVRETKANTSVIYVPAPYAADAVYEAIDAGIAFVVCITEGVPVRDMISVWQHVETERARRGDGTPRLLGANCPGVISPGRSKVGIMPGHIHKPGRIGLVSRSGTLTYEVVDQLTRAGLGQSTCIGIGGDPVIGTTFLDALQLFEADPDTDAVVLIGEIGGTDEETAAKYIRRHMTKPVVAFIAGQAAPPGKRMGHAGAIISGGKGTAAEKIAALRAAGVPVAAIPSEIPDLVRHVLAESPTRKAKKTAKAKAGATKTKTKTKSKATRKAQSKPKTKTKTNAKPKAAARSKTNSKPARAKSSKGRRTQTAAGRTRR